MNFPYLIDYPSQLWLNRRIEHPQLRPVCVIDALTSIFSQLGPADKNRIHRETAELQNRVHIEASGIQLQRGIILNWLVNGRDRVLEWDPTLLGTALGNLVRDTYRASKNDWTIELKCYLSAGMAYFWVSHFPQDELVKTALNISVKGTYVGQSYHPIAHSSLGLAVRNVARIALIHQGRLSVCEGLGHGLRFHVGLLADGRTKLSAENIPPTRIQRLIT